MICTRDRKQSEKEKRKAYIKSILQNERKALWLVIIVFLFTLLSLCYPFFRGLLKEPFFNTVAFWEENGRFASCSFEDMAKYWGELVWALTASDAAFIIFYYGALNQTNYGIPHRMMNTYMYGAYFIPVLLMGTFSLSVLMVLMLFLKCFSIFYLVSFETLILQLMIIFCCISVTSRYICKETVLKIEKKQYITLHEQVTGREDQMGQVTLKYADLELLEKNRIYHIENIMKGTEPVNERMQFIERILNIPFETCSENGFYAFKSHMKKNLDFVFLSDRTLISESELQAALFMVYRIVINGCKIYMEEKAIKQKRTLRIKLLLFLGCIFQIWVHEDNLNERWIALDYIMNGILPEEDEVKAMSFRLLLMIMLIEEKDGQSSWEEEDFGRIASQPLLKAILSLEAEMCDDLCIVLYTLLIGYTVTVKRETIYWLVSQLPATSPCSEWNCLLSYLSKITEEDGNDTLVSV